MKQLADPLQQRKNYNERKIEMLLANYLELFPGASRDRPRFMQLAEAVLQQAIDLASVVSSLASAFSISEASGCQLDMIGESFGLSRGGLDDAGYRMCIRNKLLLWRWDGTNEGVPEVMEQIAPGSAMTDNRDGTVTVTGTVPAGLVPVPAGIQITT